MIIKEIIGEDEVLHSDDKNKCLLQVETNRKYQIVRYKIGTNLYHYEEVDKD